jgi:hypothetical protein
LDVEECLADTFADKWGLGQKIVALKANIVISVEDTDSLRIEIFQTDLFYNFSAMEFMR